MLTLEYNYFHLKTKYPREKKRGTSFEAPCSFTRLQTVTGHRFL
jgi:hypothetical protein